VLTGLGDRVDTLLADPSADDKSLTGLYDELLRTEVAADWPYDEPNALPDILATLPAVARQPTGEALRDKIHGAWLGRCAGCNLGKPVELGEYWTQSHIRAYLETAQAWPLDDYVPAMDPMPAQFQLRECWPDTTLGNIHGSARDDDIDYTILGLYLIERHGTNLRPDDVAAEWLDRLPYMMTYTAERATYRNVINGVPADLAGEIDNPYREWIGAQIRGDIFGFVNPGNPRAAATEAFQDAALSHRANGIYGEMWSAALVAAAFTAPDAEAAIRSSLEHIPPRSRLYEAITDVLGCHTQGASWEICRAHIESRYGHYNWVHTVNNAALVAAGLLWGNGDFTQSICLTVVGGWDTDSNGATAGSVAGILSGAGSLPDKWTAPLENHVRSALAGFDRTQISELVDRTLDVIRRRGRPADQAAS
jgi:ADP-ribosylglycohydrolase